MLTPVDIQNKNFKGGIGFDKKDVEAFMIQVSNDYSELYRSNVELKDKVNTLNESLQHYKSIEDSMQKALTISEKTSEETINAATDKARQITTEAELKAEQIISDSRQELQDTKDEIFRLKEQLNTFKEQFNRILTAELKMLDGEIIDIDLGEGFEPSAGYSSSGHSSYSEGGLGGEGGLGSEGGLGGGGGYTGNNPSNFEKTSQDPTIERNSLNMDPFSNASNGGRFSKQTGGTYTQSSSKKSTGSTSLKTATSSKDTGKSSLNIKQNDPNANKIKRVPVQPSNNFTKDDTLSSNIGNNSSSTPQNNLGSNLSYNSSSTIKNDSSSNSSINISNNLSNNISENIKVSDAITGEVENKVNESNMLDSEDNYSTGFDFVDDDSSIFVSDDSSSTLNDNETLSGEVESKINESNMLDSEDNYNTGFDFISGNEAIEDDIPTILSNSGSVGGNDEDTVFVGDVEDKLNDSHLIGNDDDDDSGFNFL